jgi:CDGSH iron-sulfur domain-containing protein 3
MKNFLSSGRQRQLQRQAPTPVRPGSAGRDHPHVVELVPGDYRWCGCGRPAGAPLCDAGGADCATRSLRFTVTARSGMQWLCGCGRSRQLPFCDGSTHNQPR